MFQAGRYFAGQGIGILVTIVPMFISEMAHPTKRGWLVGHHAIFLVFGYMLSSWVGFGCYCKDPRGTSFFLVPMFLRSCLQYAQGSETDAWLELRMSQI